MNKKIDYSKIDNIVFDGIDHTDSPKYCDAYIVSADYNGIPMTENEIEKLDNSFIYKALQDYLH